jgi:hypothetical protein
MPQDLKDAAVMLKAVVPLVTRLGEDAAVRAVFFFAVHLSKIPNN